MIKNLLKEKILLEEPKLDNRRYLGDFEFEGVKYDITGEQSHTRNYNWEEVRIETSDFDSKVVGYGKYKWLNRPWQKFTFASALEQALIDWQGHKKEAYEAINESSDCLEATNKFIEKISKKEESLKEEKINLPKTVTFKASEVALDCDDCNEEEISDVLSDLLSDTYGYCHFGFNYVVKKNENGEPSEFICKNIKWDTSESLTEGFDGSCPYCHSENIDFVDEDEDSIKYICRDCGKDFIVINDEDVTTRNGFPVDESLTEDADTGYDHYGAKNMYPFEGPAFIEYDGGTRQVEVIVKAKNGRYVWKNVGGCPDSEWCIFPSYADALKVQKVVGGEIMSWNEYTGNSDEGLKLKEDADKVNGDEKDLPDAVPDEPIVVSSDPTSEIEKEEIDNGTYIMINDLVQKEWESINNIKSIIATLSAEENANQDVIAILESAVDEKTVTVGMLTKASEIVNDKQNDLMQKGIEKAEEVVGEESAEDIDSAEKEFPVDESLKK